MAADLVQRNFVWTDAMSVGIPEIDADHQVLLDLIGQIADTAGDSEAENVIGTVLAALLDYTDYHFTREEKMQQACGYPQFADHKATHGKLKAQVVDYMKRFSDDPQSVDVGDLYAFLKSWLVDHILREDMGYRSLCADHPEARAAVRSVGLEFFMAEES